MKVEQILKLLTNARLSADQAATLRALLGTHRAAYAEDVAKFDKLIEVCPAGLHERLANYTAGRAHLVGMIAQIDAALVSVSVAA